MSKQYVYGVVSQLRGYPSTRRASTCFVGDLINLAVHSTYSAAFTLECSVQIVNDNLFSENVDHLSWTSGQSFILNLALTLINSSFKKFMDSTNHWLTNKVAKHEGRSIFTGVPLKSPPRSNITAHISQYDALLVSKDLLPSFFF